jgi:hypothetical protein
MAGVPVAVVVERASLFENAGQFNAARAHEVDVGAVEACRSSKARFSFVSPQKTS